MRGLVELGDGVGPVRRQLLGTLEVLAVVGPVPERREVDQDERAEQHADHEGDLELSSLGEPSREQVHADAEQHREPEDDERSGASDAAEGQPDRGALAERLHDRAEGRRVVVRVCADRDAHAEQDEGDEVDAVTPPDERRGQHRQDGDPVADDDQPAA